MTEKVPGLMLTVIFSSETHLQDSIQSMITGCSLSTIVCHPVTVGDSYSVTSSFVTFFRKRSATMLHQVLYCRMVKSITPTVQAQTYQDDKELYYAIHGHRRFEVPVGPRQVALSSCNQPHPCALPQAACMLNSLEGGRSGHFLSMAVIQWL